MAETVDPKVTAFLDDIRKVCEKHDMCISHEDTSGEFLIVGFDQGALDWLSTAGDIRPYLSAKAWYRADLIREEQENADDS